MSDVVGAGMLIQDHWRDTLDTRYGSNLDAGPGDRRHLSTSRLAVPDSPYWWNRAQFAGRRSLRTNFFTGQAVFRKTSNTVQIFRAPPDAME